MNPEDSTRVVRFADLLPTPWRNGGGTTRELMVGRTRDDAHEPDWRVSVADVTTPGPFSNFSGVDRVLVLCRGVGMVVDIDGQAHRLGCYDMVRFAGEQFATASLVDGATVDLNVMTRRKAVRATVVLIPVEESAVVVSAVSATSVVVVVLHGSVWLQHDPSVGLQEPGSSLQPFDAVRLAPVGSCAFRGQGLLARIDLTAARVSHQVREPTRSMPGA